VQYENSNHFGIVLLDEVESVEKELYDDLFNLEEVILYEKTDLRCLHLDQVERLFQIISYDDE
jgi:hypothetical protein